MGTSTEWFQALLADGLVWIRLAIGWGTAQLSLLLLSLGVLGRASALARGSRGRARIVALAITGVLHALVTSAIVGTLLWAAKVSIGHVLGGSVASLLFGLTHLAYPDVDLEWIAELYYVAKNLNVLTSASMLILAIACWFLIRMDSRRRFWWFFDGALVIAVLQSSMVWLGITIMVDMAIGGYVAMILTAKQPKVVRRAPVVPIQAPIQEAPTTAADLNVESAPPTVRVIAG